MTATIRIPRMLSDAVGTPVAQSVEQGSVAVALADLFAREPGLRPHILDEAGTIRPHVSVFVDGIAADLTSDVRAGSEIRILHAVSGG